MPEQVEAFIPAGLESSHHPSVANPMSAQVMLNCEVTRGIFEARMGMAEHWRHGASISAYSSGDLGWGFGFGRYNGTEELIGIVQHNNGDTHCRVYSIDASTGTTLATYEQTAWNYRYASQWQFCQQGQYIYAVNENDGYWKKKIGDSTAAAWSQVIPTLVNSIGSGNGTISAYISNPSTDYPVPDVWSSTSGGLYGTYVAQFNATGTPSYGITTDGALYMTDSASATGVRKITACQYFTFNSARDFSRSRFWSIPIEVVCNVDPTIRPNQDPVWDWGPSGGRVFRAFITTDATAPTSSSTSYTDAKWVEVTCHFTPDALSLYVPNRYTTGTLEINFEHLASGTTNTTLTGIKKIAIVTPIQGGQQYTANFYPPYQGGTMMSKPDTNTYMDPSGGTNPLGTYPSGYFKDIKYAFTNYDTGSNTESAATFVSVTGSSAVGTGRVTGAMPLGAQIAVSYVGPAGGYNRVRIYRQRHADSDQWYLIKVDTAAGTYTDSFVDSTTDPLNWNSDLGANPQIIQPAGYNFGYTTPTLNPSCITAWRGHTVLGVGTEVYLSYQGLPEKFVAPLRSSQGTIATDDVTMGRTLYMSYTLGDKVQALHAPNELYAIGTEGIYAMVGESALNSTPFRKLPGTHGSIGPRASWPLNDGVLVATYSGLWWYRVARVNTSVEATTTNVEEVTADVRATYLDLISRGAPDDVVVMVHEDQIYVVRGRYFLKRNKEGGWEYGAWSTSALSTGTTSPSNVYGDVSALPALPTNGQSVTRNATMSTYTGFDFSPVTSPGAAAPGISYLVSDPKYGLLGMTRSGLVVRLERDINGNRYTSDSGYPIPYIYVFSEQIAPAGRKISGVQALVESATTATNAGGARFLIEEYDGMTGTKAYGKDKASTDNHFNLLSQLSTMGGFGHTIIVAVQSAAHKIARLFVSFDDGVSRRRGN